MATEAESGHNYLAGPEKGGLPRERDDRCCFNSEFAVSFLDHALKIVLADVDDADLTFGILFGITRMSGVDHDRRTKLAGATEESVDHRSHFATQLWLSWGECFGNWPGRRNATLGRDT